MGKLAKISGPVIVAEDMAGAQMNEVVKVGDEELLGEIISLKYDRASIQVYEDTSGLKPGDKVLGTGAPLQVELGPGLLKAVFDGIQRPLDVIQEKTGAFIQRGVNIPALDIKKKWEFEAIAKKGRDVSAGDVLGTVQETNITHQILVPPMVKPGKLSWIKSGKYTVREGVAHIGKTEVGLSHLWSVRQPRPVKEKLRFANPLVTGKRIIDTFFPMAKGGAGAIPGPFGSGKCVSGDTPVLLQNGVLTPIQTLFEQAKSDVKNTVKETVFEQTIELTQPLNVFSLHENRIQATQTRLLYKGKSDSLIRVTTRSGKTATVTPVHKLFKIRHDGGIEETPAAQLQKGDFLAVPRQLPAFAASEFDVYALSWLRVEDEDIRDTLSTVLQNRIQQQGKMKTATELQLTSGEVKRLAYRETLPTLRHVKTVHAYYGLPLPHPQKLRGERRGNATILPRMSAELAEFLGLFTAEGYIRGSATVVFTNLDEAMLDRFSQLSRNVFGIKAKIERQPGKTPNVLATSTVLVSYLKHIGLGGNASRKRIPAIVLSSDVSTLSAFLKAYYLGDGSFSQGEVEFTTASETLASGIAYALARISISATLNQRVISGKTYYRVFVRGKPNLDRLVTAFGTTEDKTRKIKHYVNQTRTAYTATDVVPVDPTYLENWYREARSPYAKLKQRGVEIHNYIGNKERMSVSAFNAFADTVAEHAGSGKAQQMLTLQQTLQWISCDEVVSVDVFPGPHDVYDISLPGIENWVGGNQPMLLHNTVNQQDLAKYSDAQVIVYIGCGERGNEMTEVLTEFPQLEDPKTKKPLMERTVLIANTSNMPVAAREASVYTGITLAEYYRDMGYSVALMADSTSRWAEAMREISGRMEEMPGEEGYPAYLGRKLAEFYERAGKVQCLGSPDREGSVTVVGAVSPAGGDISEPVSQGTLRITKVFWALDANLSRRRHYPAINWLKSYSLYDGELEDWYAQNVAKEFYPLRAKAMNLLQKEEELQNIVQLIGPDALPDKERLVLEATKMIREDFLQQNSFDPDDAYTSPQKQYFMLKTILHYYDKANDALATDVSLEKILSAKAREEISKLKRVPEKQVQKTCEQIQKDFEHALR